MDSGPWITVQLQSLYLPETLVYNHDNALFFIQVPSISMQAFMILFFKKILFSLNMLLTFYPKIFYKKNSLNLLKISN